MSSGRLQGVQREDLHGYFEVSCGACRLMPGSVDPPIYCSFGKLLSLYYQDPRAAPGEAILRICLIIVFFRFQCYI